MGDNVLYELDGHVATINRPRRLTPPGRYPHDFLLGVGPDDPEVESVPMFRSVGGPWARVLVVVSALLLLSMGGAIFAAPLTLPLLNLAVRGDRIGAGLRTAAVVIAALTAAEVAWAATYLAVAEAQPWIWVLPFAAAAATAVTFARTPGRLAPV
jgi:hypothetical protein